MVFKTICVGSIPATLVIVVFSSPLRKKKINYRKRYKNLRRKLRLNPYSPNHTITRCLQKIDRKFALAYRKSRRIKGLLRSNSGSFKFLGFIKPHQRSSGVNKIKKPLGYTSHSNMLTWKTLQLLKTRSPNLINTGFLGNSKLRKKNKRKTILFHLLRYVNRYSHTVMKYKTLSGTTSTQLNMRRRKVKRSVSYNKVSSYNKSQNTRAYKLEYDEKFSLRFIKNYQNARKNLPFLTNHSLFSTTTLVPVLSLFALTDMFSNTWHAYQTNFLKSVNTLKFAPESIKITSVAYSQQVRNSLFLNSIKAISSTSFIANQSVFDSKPRFVTDTLELTNKDRTSGSIQLARDWALESDFVRRKNLTAPNAIFVLGKAPTYRMSKNSESPISTSQQNGNFFNSWSRLTHKNTNTLALFSKANLTPFLFKLNRAKPNLKIEQTLVSSYSSISLDFATQRNLDSRKLMYVKPTNVIALQNSDALHLANPSSRLRTNLKVSVGMRQVSIPYRKKTKRYTRSRPILLRKQKLLKAYFLFSRKRQLFLKKRLKRNIKRVSRFFRWKTKRATLFFTKCIKMARSRKNYTKKLYNTSNVSSRNTKYNVFNLNVIPSKPRITKLGDSSSSLDNNVSPFKHLLPSLQGLKSLTHSQTSILVLNNPLLIKSFIFSLKGPDNHKITDLLLKSSLRDYELRDSNLIPHQSFNKVFTKKVLNSFANRLFRDDIIPLYQNTLIRFIEFCTGKKAMFQFYPFVNQHIDKIFMVRYKRWLPRMSFYERRLGHRFFLEESLHIIHISFILRDPKIIASWLRAMILRISFWKTRSIFRFLKYLFHNYFIHVFDDIKIKGLKIRLKGKISAAGNSRKRTILYRIGSTSHSEVNLRVVKDFSLIHTFTGVMGFQVYLFY